MLSLNFLIHCKKRYNNFCYRLFAILLSSWRQELHGEMTQTMYVHNNKKKKNTLRIIKSYKMQKIIYTKAPYESIYTFIKLGTETFIYN
jgi:hypothetical protein